MSGCTAPAARPRTASRKHSSISSDPRELPPLPANQLRVLLAALAYTLMSAAARARAQRQRARASNSGHDPHALLKIGAAIVRNTRRVRVLLASHHPLHALFLSAAQALAP